jgi:hypothetical protein
MRGDRVGQLAGSVDLGSSQHLGRDLLVELDVLLELLDHGATAPPARGPSPSSSTIFSIGLEEVGRSVKPVTRARALPSTSTLTVPSGSFSSCSTVARVPTS